MQGLVTLDLVSSEQRETYIHTVIPAMADIPPYLVCGVLVDKLFDCLIIHFKNI